MASEVKFRPLNDRVLVRRDEAASRTPQGLILPETGKEKPKSGVVEAVGQGVVDEKTGQRTPLALVVGDKVLFGSYAGTEVKLNGIDYLVMHESDVLGVVES